MLGVSCGSGYLIVCFAELVKPNEKVVGVEHIRKLVKILITNARKSWSHHLRSGLISYC